MKNIINKIKIKIKLFKSNLNIFFLTSVNLLDNNSALSIQIKKK